MRHILWLVPLLLGIGLMIWCQYHPLPNTGREFLAGLMIFISGMCFAFMLLDKIDERFMDASR